MKLFKKLAIITDQIGLNPINMVLFLRGFPVYLFDYAMNDPSGIVFSSENRFGFSIMSIDWILIGLYNLLSSDYIPSLFTISDGFLTYGYQVSDKTTVNAFFTFFTFFFVDYGYLAPFMFIAYHFLFSMS